MLARAFLTYYTFFFAAVVSFRIFIIRENEMEKKFFNAVTFFCVGIVKFKGKKDRHCKLITGEMRWWNFAILIIENRVKKGVKTK